MDVEEKIKELDRLKSTINRYIEPEEFRDFWMGIEPVEGPMEEVLKKAENMNQNAMKQVFNIDFQWIENLILSNLQNAVTRVVMKLYEKYDEMFQKPRLDRAEESWREIAGADFPYVSGEQGEQVHYSEWKAITRNERSFGDIKGAEDVFSKAEPTIGPEKEVLPVRKSSLEQQILGAKETLASKEPTLPKRKEVEKGLDFRL